MIVHEHDAPQRTLVFLLGAAGTGKTYHCLEGLRAGEASGREAFYLVPEQSTYLADREMLDPEGGPEAVRHVRVLSFRRIAHLLEGGREKRLRPLDPAARRVLLRNLVQGLEPSLQQEFSRVLDRPGFTETLAHALRELRYECGPEGIAWLDSPRTDSGLPDELRKKVELLSALRRDYDRALYERELVDPDLFLAGAPTAIRDHPEFFRGREVYVDGYLSFTRLETEMLLALALAGANLTIALCCDPGIAARAEACPPPIPPGFKLQRWPHAFLSSLDRPVFLGPARTYLEIATRFRHAGFRIETQPLPRSGVPGRFRTPALLTIAERALQTDSIGESMGAATRGTLVSLFVARDPAHEVEIWARAIDRWIRLDARPEADPGRTGLDGAQRTAGRTSTGEGTELERPLRPGEIAVIVRDLEPYRPYVEPIFRRFEIPFFIDRHWDLASRPLARTVLSALEILRSGWARDAVMSYLRAPLAGASPGEVDLLENLSLEAGFEYGRWYGSPWEPIVRPPRVRFLSRSDTDEEPEREAEAKTRRIQEREREWETLRTSIANRLRATHLEPIRGLELSLESAASPRESAALIRRWIERCGIRNRFLGADHGSAESADREWDAVLEVVDRVGDESSPGPIEVDHLVRLLRAGLDSLQLGRTPTGCDQVALTEVQRSRLGTVRAAIVGGLTSNQYPRLGAELGFWSSAERERLGALGFALGTPDALRQEEEPYFFYIAMTRASEHTLLTRPASDSEGRTLDPSPYLNDLIRAMPDIHVFQPATAEDPSSLEGVQIPADLSERVGAYLASRFDRRITGRTTSAPLTTLQENDRRILTVYNHIVRSPGIPSAAPLLEHAARLWGYDNHARLSGRHLELLRHQGDLVASASRIETFARCPYHHFAGNVLRLRPRPEARVSPLEMGSLAHRVLEVLFRRGAPTQDPAQVQKDLEEVYESIAMEEAFRAFREDVLGAFRWRSSRRQILKYLESEARRLAKTPFRPYAFEEAFGTEERPALRIDLGDGTHLLLRGRIDRIDVRDTEEGREALIIDYKSTTHGDRGGLRNLESGLDLQLAVYMLAAEAMGYNPVGALYVPVLHRPHREDSGDTTDNEPKARGLVPDDRYQSIGAGTKMIVRASRENRIDDVAGLREALDQARAILRAYGLAIKQGHIDVAPVRHAGRTPCDSCDFRGLCRVDPDYNRIRTSPLDGLDVAEEGRGPVDIDRRDLET